MLGGSGLERKSEGESMNKKQNCPKAIAAYTSTRTDGSGRRIERGATKQNCLIAIAKSLVYSQQKCVIGWTVKETCNVF